MLRVLIFLLAFATLGAWAQSTAPFVPSGATVAVDNSAAQQVISTNGMTGSMQYRIRNTGAAAAYIGWSTPNISSGTPTIGTTAPVVGTVQNNIFGMLAQSVEVFTLPANAWFKASTGATFEVTPGQGN